MRVLSKKKPPRERTRGEAYDHLWRTHILQ